MSMRSERDRIAHLLRRFGLGASEQELEFYGKLGLSGAIDHLLKAEDPSPSVALEAFETKKGAVKIAGVQGWWALRMATTQAPLREKMTLFWHDHFATSAAKVTIPQLMANQNELLRANALGSFRDLLREVSLDPAMLYWLDNQENVAGAPNENFARELMELFTVGLDNGYTEEDVREVARAFTGHGFKQRGGNRQGLPRGPFFVDRTRHDGGAKRILGREGNFDGDDVIDLLCERPQTARYLTEKILAWFMVPDPESALVDRFARRFSASGLSISALLRDVMESEEFYSERAERAITKNPVDFVIPIVRQAGLGSTLVKAAETGNPQGACAPLLYATKNMGMDLLFPPDVAGWEHGGAWITSATMIQRAQFAPKLFGVAERGVKGSKGRNPNFRFDAWPLVSSDPTPKGVVAKMLSLFDVPPMPTKVPVLEAAVGSKLTPNTADERAAAVCRLIFAAPEFQFC
jgi:uncharacterized protein (DUF1800 family)